MTQPRQTQAAAQADQERAGEYITAAAAAMVTPMAVATSAAVAWLMARWATVKVIRIAGREAQFAAEAARIRAEYARRLTAVHPHLAPAAAREAAAGLQLGRELAGDRQKSALPDDVAETVRGIDAVARAAVVHAVRTAERLPLATDTDAATLASQATGATAKARAYAAWTAATAVNAGTYQVAVERAGQLIWVAERDACLVCLALSGQVVQAGAEFDADLTFGDAPMPRFPIAEPTPLLHPPRHPHCRCHARIYVDHPGPAGGSLPVVLAREAQRSALRGFSNHASHAARLRAAARTAARPGAPAGITIQRRGRRDVGRSAFSSRHNELVPALPPGRGKR